MTRVTCGQELNMSGSKHIENNRFDSQNSDFKNYQLPDLVNLVNFPSLETQPLESDSVNQVQGTGDWNFTQNPPDSKVKLCVPDMISFAREKNVPQIANGWQGTPDISNAGSVVGRITSLKDVHVLNPGTVNMLPYWQRDYILVIKVRVFTEVILSQIIRMGSAQSHESLKEEGNGSGVSQRDITGEGLAHFLLSLKVEEKES